MPASNPALSGHCVPTKSPFWKAAVASVVFSIVSLGAVTANAAPATWVVDDLSDGTPVATHHTLRTAVAAAAAGDFIEFAPDLFSGNLPKSLSLTKGAITLTKDLTVVGPGDAANTHVPMLEIVGNGTNRLFQISSQANVTISGLRLRHGGATTSGGTSGGGVLVDPKAKLTLLECDVTDCKAGIGGGILNLGTLTLDQCLIARNEATTGGGIASSGELQISRSLIQSNTATVTGGGVYQSNTATSATPTFGVSSFVLESSTVTGNHAGKGGGISVISYSQPSVAASLIGVTMTGNTADDQSGGLYVEGNTAISTVGSSILADNRRIDFHDSDDNGPAPRDLAVKNGGQIISADYNIIAKPGSDLNPAGSHDQLNVSPQLGSLADNGGRTLSYLPDPSSLAINRGSPVFSGNLVPTDQRGLARVSPQPGGIADVGAVEVAGPSLTLPAEFIFECTGLQTSGLLTGSLSLPGGGQTTVTWIFNGVAVSSATVSVPSNDVPVDLTQTGLFHFGSNTATLRVVYGNFTVERSTLVTVKDTIAPAISVNGAAPAILEWGAQYTDAGATVTDACDPAPTLTVTLPFPADSVYPTGTFSVGYKATDFSGNSSTATRVVSVLDTVKPVITLNGASTIYVEWGTPYAEQGATAQDNHDGDVFVTVDASAVEAAIGNYQVRYNAVDASGNHAPEVIRTVIVQDTKPPVITRLGDATVYVECDTDYSDLGATALDNHDGLLGVSVSGSVNTKLLGSYTVSYNASDLSGNAASTVTRTVVVRDTTPPVITLHDPAAQSAAWGSNFVDPGASAEDSHDGPVTVTVSSNLNLCIPGQYDITYAATDKSGNQADATRVVTVVNTVALAVSTLSQEVDPALGTAGIDLSQVVSGVQSTPCNSKVSYNLTITKLPGKPGDSPKVLAQLTKLPALPIYQFPAGTSSVRIEVEVEGASQPLLDSTFTVQATDPFNVSLTNLVWPLALELPTTPDPANSKITGGSFKQMIARSGESRWFKIHGAPGSRIEVRLKKLPANFDLVVYSDIHAEFSKLLELLASNDPETQKQAVLGAQSSQEAYLQEAYLQEAYLQEAYLQEAYLQEAYLQEAYLQEAYLPETYSQEAYLQEAYLQEAYLQEAYLQEAYLPAFSTAQQKSLISFSASSGTADEYVRFNTYSRSGDFYIRVRGNNGLFSLDAPFEIEVQIVQDLASNVTDLNTTPAIVPNIPGSPTSLLIWDSSRVPGTSSEKSALAGSLASFAQAAHGFVLDVSSDSRVNALNAQADANPAIPLAKNLVAETIRNLILRCRAISPSLRDITLVGSDNVIPFFRKSDNAQLAGELNYYPPVKDGTHSQSSLRLNQVLTQDRYGSSAQVSLPTGPYDLPEMPVGRLVESASEVQAYLNAYTPLFNGSPSSGTLPTPRTAFVSGYEFLADSAAEMRNDFQAGLGAGGLVDTLISPADVPPAQGWNADQLRSALLGSRHDLAYIGGHFSGGGTLAADYQTRMTAKELDDSPVNMQYSLVLSTGCHSGYNTIDGDSITLLTEQPDWAQAFGRKKALWISGTGYQYGDTDFVEYTERLQLEVARALRTGTGPVSIGQALTNAKLRYLNETAVMRGIHEKTLLQLTLYGLPMVKINVAGTRLAAPTNLGDVAATNPAGGAGASHLLRTGEITLVPVLTKVNRTLKVLGTNDTIVASYYQGSDGIVSVPGEPVRALESLNVSRPTDGLVRGIGFRGGNYRDDAGHLPFVGVPVTESSGVHGRFYTEVHYPVSVWNLNQSGELGSSGAAGSKLNVFPTQFLSDGPESATGYLRIFQQLKFTVFYCPEISTAALINAPALNSIASKLQGNLVSFEVEAATAKEAGVQEVWITYTGLPGSPYFGKWQSMTLTAPANEFGIGTWTGTLPLTSAADASGFRYLVQAVNGFGAVVASTNFGRFYRVDNSTQDAALPKLPVSLTLTGPIPTSAAFKTPLPVEARLTDQSGQPLAGRMIRFSVGAAIKTVATGSNGVATTTLTLNASPGNYELGASFAGDAYHGNANDSRAFMVTKLGTQLTPLSSGTVAQSSDIYFDLRALDGSPVSERTVMLLLKNGSITTAFSATSDNFGRVRLPDTGITPATYQITAKFGQPVLLPSGETVPLDDPLYGPSSATKSVTITSSLRFTDEQAWLNYNDRSARNATSSNRGLTKTEITGDIRAQSPAFNPKSILSSPRANSVTVTLHATMSGKVIATGSFKLNLQSSDRLHWRGNATLKGVAVQLYLDWEDCDDHRNKDSGRYHIWITTPAGSGPLYNDSPALLVFELTLGTGTGEHPLGGSSIIGGPEKPWTKQNANSRVRTSH